MPLGKADEKEEIGRRRNPSRKNKKGNRSLLFPRGSFGEGSDKTSLWKECAMASLRLRMVSPFPVYLDESTASSALAPRPATLDGKVLGLLPNWRPSAVRILKALGTLLEQRYRLKAVVMEQPVREAPISKGGNLLDGMRGHLDDLARRVDVVVTATGD